MTTFQTYLAVRANKAGRAQPSALYRHRALTTDALCVVAYQLGAEPYSVGAIALGRQTNGGPQIFVPGYPLDRDLLFAALQGFAQEFCPRFEAYASGPTETRKHFGRAVEVPQALPQIIVANCETIALLGRLGRRLAYLPIDGPKPADPLLPRLGRHLMWIAEHAQMPGQQIIVSAQDLLATHYQTAMSRLEMQSLPALDAWINPPADMGGFAAAEIAERLGIGPVPSPAEGKEVYDLMAVFNEKRGGSKDPAQIERLLGPLKVVYRDMVERTWNLTGKVIERERARPEAESVAARAADDRLAYAEHMQWMTGPAQGLRKARMPMRRAAMRLNDLENAAKRVEAEEALDDALRMAPYVLSGRAIAGEVIACDARRREVIKNRNLLRPSVTLRTETTCCLPVNSELWWTKAAGEREWRVDQVIPVAGGGSELILILQTNRSLRAGLPEVGQRAVFSQLNTRQRYEMVLPKQIPWTHRPIAPGTPTDLDYSESEGNVV